MALSRAAEGPTSNGCMEPRVPGPSGYVGIHAPAPGVPGPIPSPKSAQCVALYATSASASGSAGTGDPTWSSPIPSGETTSWSSVGFVAAALVVGLGVGVPGEDAGTADELWECVG